MRKSCLRRKVRIRLAKKNDSKRLPPTPNTILLFALLRSSPDLDPFICINVENTARNVLYYQSLIAFH